VFLESWYKFYCVLARSRYKFDRSCKFIPGYKFGNGHWRSVAVQAISEPGNCHGAGYKLRTDVRVRVQEPLQICLRSRSKSKNRDKQLTHIVRVRFRGNFITVSVPENCLVKTLSHYEAGCAGRLFTQTYILIRYDCFDLRDVPARGDWLLKF